MIKDCKVHYSEMYRVRMMEAGCPFCRISELEAALSRYEQATRVEGMIYSNRVRSTFGDDYNKIELMRVPNLPDITQGQRVTVLVMPSEG